jgi:hypothetical protein
VSRGGIGSFACPLIVCTHLEKSITFPGINDTDYDSAVDAQVPGLCVRMCVCVCVYVYVCVPLSVCVNTKIPH